MKDWQIKQNQFEQDIYQKQSRNSSNIKQDSSDSDYESSSEEIDIKYENRQQEIQKIKSENFQDRNCQVKSNSNNYGSLNSIVSQNQKTSIVSIPVAQQQQKKQSKSPIFQNSLFEEEIRHKQLLDPIKTRTLYRKKKQIKKKHDYKLPQFFHKDYANLKEAPPPIINDPAKSLHQYQSMKTSTEFMNKGAHFEMVNLSQHLLNDIKMIDSILEKSYINLKEFTKNSHLQISNIIKGLECKIIQSKIKSKSSNSVITTYNPEEKNQFNITEQDQPEVLKYQRMHMPKLNQLKDQISNISSLLEQIEKQSFISANKNEVELKFDHYIKELKIPVGLRQVEKVHTYDDRFYLLENAEKTILEVVALNEIENHIQAQSLFTYRQDFTVTAMHEDRIIIDERVFNLDGVQICALDRYELITGITPLKGNLLAVGHESYGKCEIFAWNGNTYIEIQKLRCHRGMMNHHTFNMKYNKFIDEINMSYQLSTIIFYIHIQIGGILHQETSVIGSTRNSKKLIKDYKFISADYLLVQREQAIHIYEIDVPEPPIHQIPIDYNGPILYNLNFNIAQFAVGVVLTRDGYFQVADIMKSGYKNKYKHQVIQGLPLCQVSLGNGDDFENREKFSCIIKVKNGQLAVLLGSMQ